MSGRGYSRRETMKMLAALPVAAAAAPRQRTAAPQRSVRLGGPIPLATRDGQAADPVALAKEARRLGYRAMLCPPVALDDAPRIRAIAAACQAEDVVIAEVNGFGFNMMARDAAERKAALDTMCERLALADEIGALCAVNIAGFRGPDAKSRPHPENLNAIGFDLTVENVRHVVDTVKPKRAKFAVEGMPWIVPDGPDSYLSLIRAVDRPAFAAHFDPVNMINSPRRHFDNGRFLEECFTKIGRWIVSCHGKDTLMNGDAITHINEGRPGTGILDWRTFLKGVADLPLRPPILLEHLPTQDEYLQARDYVFAQGKAIGVTF